MLFPRGNSGKRFKPHCHIGISGTVLFPGCSCATLLRYHASYFQVSATSSLQGYWIAISLYLCITYVYTQRKRSISLN